MYFLTQHQGGGKEYVIRHLPPVYDKLLPLFLVTNSTTTATTTTNNNRNATMATIAHKK